MKDFEKIIEQVRKPARYLGNEWNVTKKDFSKTDVKVALCFPDVYDIGMSHLGFRIIYGLLNSRDDTLCERVFSPWPDLSAILVKEALPLFSLESKTPLNKFDMVAFTLAYELSYTNILEMLKLGRIPLKAKDRGLEHPLIIGGGPCVVNPEPLADFFDLFVIGDGEESVGELVDTFKRMKSGNFENKSELLLELGKIDGVYVPSFYNVRYGKNGIIEAFNSLKKEIPGIVNKRIVHDLDKSFYPTKYLVPYAGIVHDRVVIEIMRGCAHQCRYCQANVCYRPLRIRSKEKILNLIEESYKKTGYEEFSLMSLSSGDYPNITSLMEEISDLAALKDKGISVSLSSLRVEDILPKLPKSIRKIKKTGLTIAPEAGTERLRKVISKEIDTGKLLEAVKVAQNEGWRRVKLYFMIGLPTENYSDIDGIIDLLRKIVELTKKGPFEITVSISPFIPKSHTPFQWAKMENRGELLKKQEYIKKRALSRRIRLKFHNPQLSFIEAVFARGDRRLGKVLLAAFESGAHFDSWDEFFGFEAWMKAFNKEGIDPEFYTKERGFDEILPWDHINVGISKSWLTKEAKNSCALH